jgi:3-deoxy-D-manno-octulosonate 8-phosphate phosphatase (KDO 8-P phosphatase)
LTKHTTHDATKVELLVLDVDGVLTDGSITLDHEGRELKRFNASDGLGMRAWTRVGLHLAIITGRTSGAVLHRAADLGVAHVIQGSKDKGAALDELVRVSRVDPSRMAFLGDDWPDVAPMRRVAYPMAVMNAHERVKARAAYVTERAGGHGAVREAIEHLLRARGLMDRALDLYDAR